VAVSGVPSVLPKISWNCLQKFFKNSSWYFTSCRRRKSKLPRGGWNKQTDTHGQSWPSPYAFLFSYQPRRHSNL